MAIPIILNLWALGLNLTRHKLQRLEGSRNAKKRSLVDRAEAVERVVAGVGRLEGSGKGEKRSLVDALR